MNGRYRVIDEVGLNILGTFATQDGAIQFVATLMSVNTDDFLDELTIAGDDYTQLYGDSLRAALKQRAATRARVGSRGSGGSHGSGDAGQGYGGLAAKGYE